jgi:hypothetical protein
MARRLRFIPDGGALVEVTCRTIQGRYLLKPSAEMRSITIGVLARAGRLYDIDLHAFVFLSNHYHLLLSARDAKQLARFMNYLNSNLAREAGRLHDWKERFWGRRYQAIVISGEESAQNARLRYLLRHGCKEGLVRSPDQWPGAHSVCALVEGQAIQGVWFDRTRECAARARRATEDPFEFASTETLELEPLPCWRHLSEVERRGLVAELVRNIRRETSREHAKNGTRPMGLRAILALHPHEKPKELKRGSAPLFHAVSKAARLDLVQAYRWFVSVYRDAARRLREGDRLASFPVGSFPPGLAFVSEARGFQPD